MKKKKKENMRRHHNVDSYPISFTFASSIDQIH